MTEMRNTNQRALALENRILAFAKACRAFVGAKRSSAISMEDVKQMVRTSGMIGVNYLDAQDAVNQDEYTHSIRIAKKEARETIYWLRLLDAPESLTSEAAELVYILGSFLEKSR